MVAIDGCRRREWIHSGIKCNAWSFKLSELRSCVKVELDLLSRIVCTVSVDVKQHWTRTEFKLRPEYTCWRLIVGRVIDPRGSRWRLCIVLCLFARHVLFPKAAQQTHTETDERRGRAREWFCVFCPITLTAWHYYERNSILVIRSVKPQAYEFFKIILHFDCLYSCLEKSLKVFPLMFI